MIERIDIEQILAVADDQRVKASMPGTRDARLRALANCIWLRDGSRFAVFQSQFYQTWQALILDIDDESEASRVFVRAALAVLFARDDDMQKVTLCSANPRAGELFGARLLGERQGPAALPFSWEVTREGRE